jgi:hypothetical protein
VKSMNDRVVINERYRSALRPLSAAELSQLEDNIVHAGEILDPILFHLSESGQEVVVDGHHRLGISRKNEDIEVAFKEVFELSGSSEDEVVRWIRNHQKGRRNEPTLADKYEIGKEVLEARENGVPASEVAEDAGITESQARHYAATASEIDEAEEASPGFREEVLSDPKMSAKQVSRIASEVTGKNPMLGFKNAKKILQSLSRAVNGISDDFHESKEVIEAINKLSSSIERWEDDCVSFS